MMGIKSKKTLRIYRSGQTAIFIMRILCTHSLAQKRLATSPPSFQQAARCLPQNVQGSGSSVDQSALSGYALPTVLALVPTRQCCA